MSLQDYPSWELSPRELSEEEVNDPVLVIHELFDFGHLPEIRDLLWELFKTAVTGNFGSELSKSERSGLISFYEKLERLIEAAHLLHNKLKA